MKDHKHHLDIINAVRKRSVHCWSSMLLLSTSLFWTSCTQSKLDLEVKHYGVLREIMMEQKIDTNILLSDLPNNQNLYGLGALAGLSGELILLEGKPYKATVNDNQELVVSSEMTGGMTLLVTAEVREWQEVSLTANVTTLSELQELINQKAIEHGIDINQPFPFLIEGTISSIKSHVINAPAATEQSHEAFKKSGIVANNSQETLTILGFYSSQHEGVFTHHGSFLHAHVLGKEGTLVGHVDALTIDNEVMLKLPKTW